jgi:hypothetical protein
MFQVYALPKIKVSIPLQVVRRHSVANHTNNTNTATRYHDIGGEKNNLLFKG